MSVHVKKCWPDSFRAVRDGRKPFEYRKEDDCKYEVGDLIILLEFDPGGEVLDSQWEYDVGYPSRLVDILSEPHYTGEVEKRVVSYVLRGRHGVPEGYAVLGFGEIEVSG